MNTLPAIARNVKRLRTLAGMSQAKLAKTAKVTQAAISKIESGAADPSLGLSGRIAKALGVSLDEIASVKILKKPS